MLNNSIFKYFFSLFVIYFNNKMSITLYFQFGTKIAASFDAREYLKRKKVGLCVI